MELISFIKNLFIDSLAGISFRNIPFIIVQLISAPIAFILGSRLLKLTKETNLLLFSVAFTLLFIVASTSVPLAILAFSIVAAFLMKKDKHNRDAQLLMLVFSFAAGSGHIILLVLSIVVITVFSFLNTRTKNE